MKKRASLGMVGRAAVAALGAVMATTLVAAPAQASQWWWVYGWERVVKAYKGDYGVQFQLAFAAAHTDLNYIRAHAREWCRHDSAPGRAIEDQFVERRGEYPDEMFYAKMRCVKNRA